MQKHKMFLGKLEEGTFCSYCISISLVSDVQTKCCSCYHVVILSTSGTISIILLAS